MNAFNCQPTQAQSLAAEMEMPVIDTGSMLADGELRKSCTSHGFEFMEVI